MKFSTEFECDCKAKTVYTFEKPGMYETHVFEDVPCSGCGSKWVMHFRQTPQGMKCAQQLRRGTWKLFRALEEKKLEDLRNAPEKKPTAIFMKR